MDILKKNYENYHINNLKINEIINNITLKDQKKFKQYKLLFNPEKFLSESFNPISKILFSIRNNISYQLRLIKYAEEKGDDYVLDNLVNFFSYRFYENILIQNAENEEFLILLFYLFKNEIENMHNASLSEFLDEETKFIGRLIRSYISRMEFKNFLRMNFNEFIMNIQNFYSNSNIELDTILIFDYFKKIKAKLDEKKTEIFGKDAITRTKSISIMTDKPSFDNESLGKAIKRSLLITGVSSLTFFNIFYF
jgi:hypothetical protein